MISTHLKIATITAAILGLEIGLLGTHPTSPPARVGRLRPIESMSAARSAHTATLLPNGDVLIVGGFGATEGQLAGAEIFERAAERFRAAEIFDPTIGRFDTTGAMAIRRHKHDAIALDDGRVLVFGGADERDYDGVYSSVEVFDPRTSRFSMVAPMRMDRYKHRGTTLRLSNGTVLLAGGATHAEEYNPASGESRIVEGDARLTGQFSTATLLPDGRALITGGYDGNLPSRSTAWIYERREERK